MDDPRFDHRATHPAAGTMLERSAWRTIPTAAATSLRSTRREFHAPGAGFVAVLDRSGRTIRWWSPLDWSTSEAACEVISGLVATAGRGAADRSPDHGTELVALFGGGSLRAACDGSHVRVAGPDGATLHEGLSFWTCDDLADAPPEAMAELLDTVELLA